VNSSDLGCVEAERALLGACLLAPTSAGRLLEDLVEDDFTDPRHRLVFTAVQALVAQGAPPDPVTVLGILRARGQQQPFTADRDAGTYLVDLAGSCPLPASGPWYRRVVLEHAWRRRVLEAGQRLIQRAGTGTLDELSAAVRDEQTQLTAAAARCPWVRPAGRVRAVGA